MGSPGVKMPDITASHFKDRIVALILGGRDLPKKPVDRHILIFSATLGLEPRRQYSEAALNEELRKWTSLFGGNFNLDHVTLRRFLVDDGYIRRDAAGGSYALATENLPYAFDPSLAGLDLENLVDEATLARELRKSRFMK
ncbi:MAG: DUF2087 domain-containing protein [Anaerolineales bacterium]